MTEKKVVKLEGKSSKPKTEDSIFDNCQQNPMIMSCILQAMELAISRNFKFYKNLNDFCMPYLRRKTMPEL